MSDIFIADDGMIVAAPQHLQDDSNIDFRNTACLLFIINDLFIIYDTSVEILFCVVFLKMLFD